MSFCDKSDDCIIISDEEEAYSPRTKFESIDCCGELAISAPTVNTRCPYTGLEMEDPVRNKRCKHSYDRKGIIHLITVKGRKARCPVSGCINDAPLSLSDLEPDFNVLHQIAMKTFGKKIRKIWNLTKVSS